jgi:predicted aspartyl protease
MTNLDPDYVLTHPVSSDEKEFAGALRMIMAASADDAELVLDSLARHAADSIVRSASHVLLTAALQYQDKWKELAEISPVRLAGKDSADVDRAGVERWAAAFKGVPRRSVVFPTGVVVVPLTLSAAGTPVIPVQINGKLKYFWLDTGSSMSIISSDVAVECGVEPLVEDTLEVATSTGRVAARPAAIRKLDIGGISISSSTAMIVAAGLMEIHVGDEQSPLMTVKIDGIVGFDVIRRLNVLVDYTNGLVRFSKPVPAGGSLSQRNFFWVGTPVVRLVSQTGIPLNLGLDTGAQETFATERLLEKVRVHTFIGDRKRIGGFGGLKEFRGRFISAMRLALRGKTLLFQKVLVFVPSVTTFVTLDGVLGSDIGRTGVVEIDAVNGVFSIDASSLERRGR